MPLSVIMKLIRKSRLYIKAHMMSRTSGFFQSAICLLTLLKQIYIQMWILEDNILA